jgi:hypothetical protein
MSYAKLRGTRYRYRGIGDVVQLTPGGSSIDPSTFIGTTLYAGPGGVSSYSTPVDGSTPLNTYNPGDPIGTVADFLPADQSQGRNEVWWVFNDDNGNPYYVPHIINDVADPSVSAGSGGSSTGTSDVATAGTANSGAPGPGSSPGTGGLGFGAGWPSLWPWLAGAAAAIVLIVIISKSGNRNN